MSQCTDEILARIADPLLFSQWKTTIQNTLNTLSQLTGADAAARKDTGITSLETEIVKYLACAREKLQAANNTPADIVSLQAQYAQVEKELNNAKNDVNVSKERAKLLTTPERKATVYEGWFPLHRPLQVSSTIFLTGITLFMFCMILGFIMLQLGLFVDIGLFMKAPGFGAPPGPFSWILSQLTPLTIGLLLGVIGLAGGLIYYVSK
jgi:hypothetical protein